MAKQEELCTLQGQLEATIAGRAEIETEIYCVKQVHAASVTPSRALPKRVLGT